MDVLQTVTYMELEAIDITFCSLMVVGLNKTLDLNIFVLGIRFQMMGVWLTSVQHYIIQNNGPSFKDMNICNNYITTKIRPQRTISADLSVFDPTYE